MKKIIKILLLSWFSIAVTAQTLDRVFDLPHRVESPEPPRDRINWVFPMPPEGNRGDLQARYSVLPPEQCRNTLSNRNCNSVLKTGTTRVKRVETKHID